MVTSPMEYEGWSSKIGVQVVPAFVVFQTPPEPTAMYQVVGSAGWTAMSAMRPPIRAGPIPRSARPCAASAMRVGSGGVWAAARDGVTRVQAPKPRATRPLVANRRARVAGGPGWRSRGWIMVGYIARRRLRGEVR